MIGGQISCSLSSVTAVFLVLQIGTAAASFIDDTDLYITKKIGCVSSTGNCFNTEQCCDGLTCVTLANQGDEPETPGQCIKGKDLRECSSVEDCFNSHGFSGDNIQCVTLPQSRSSGQRYCLRSPSSEGAISERSMTQLSGPRKHHSFARLLSNIAGSCETDADCQAYAANNAGSRLCCQLVSQGRQGTRRICDRITAVSVCIPPRMQ